MDFLNHLTEGERKLVLGDRAPQFPEGHYDIDEIQIVMESLTSRIQPFASYVLNRVNVWLGGDSRWSGDETFDVEHQDLDGLRSHILTRKADGATWSVDIWPTQQDPETREITISVFEPGAGSIRIASGDISNGGTDAFRFRVEPGAVDGSVAFSSFNDLCVFSQAIRGSIPSRLLVREPVEDFRAFLPMMRVIHAGTLENELLLADRGLPGRVCQARQAYLADQACSAVMGWMQDRLVPLADELRAAGAEWGNAIMSYNDGDYSCCSVTFADGAKGYFSDNAATGLEQHSFVARFGSADDGVETVSVRVIDGDDVPGGVAAFLAGDAQPHFVYDFGSARSSFPCGRDGWTAMSLLFWQFVTDSNCALQEGSLKDADSFWSVAATASPL